MTLKKQNLRKLEGLEPLKEHRRTRKTSHPQSKLLPDKEGGSLKLQPEALYTDSAYRESRHDVNSTSSTFLEKNNSASATILASSLNEPGESENPR